MNNDLHQAHVAAYHDAQKGINKLLWFVVGIVGNLLGVIIAAIYEPTPSTTHLYLNKHSQEFIAYYIDNYRIKGKSIQQNWAAIGFGSQFVIIALFIVWVNQYT